MENLVEIAVKSGKFPTLVKAVEAAGLVGALSSPGPFTVFAPNEDVNSSSFKSVGVPTRRCVMKGNICECYIYC